MPQALFKLSSPYVGDSPLPPDRPLAEALRTSCSRVGFECAAIEASRGIGWSFVATATAGGERFEVQLARHRHQASLLSILPLDLPVPGIAARRGAQLEATGELRRLCAVIHTHLSQVSGAHNLRWMLGGPPESVPLVDSPQRLPWNEGI
jgi:hypothetical protein